MAVKSFIVVGDPHLSNVNIMPRKDATSDTCLNKLGEIVDYAIVNGVSDIVSLGDFFSVPVTSNTWLNTLFGILARAKNSGITFWTLVGNHPGDVSYKDYSTWETKDLGLLEKAGLIKILGRVELLDGRVWMGISAYTHKDIKSWVPDPNVTTVFCHHFLDNGFPGEDNLLLTEDILIAFPNITTIFSGHDHAYHNPKTLNPGSPVTLYRPGSMMRTASDKSSDRIPGFYHVTASDPKMVPLKCAEPYERVFSVELKDDTRAVDKQLDAFEKSISETSKVQSRAEGLALDLLAKVTDSETRAALKADLQALGVLG